MILEVATLNIKLDQSEQFEKDFASASQYISSIDGYISHSLQKCIEVENKYILLVQWKDIDSHELGFRKSDVYQKWKALLHHYYDPFPTVEHYKEVYNQHQGE